jgi:hypothetical protein
LVAAVGHGGPEGGSVERRGILIRPYGAFAESLKFKGGVRALVVVTGRLQTDADLYVYDDSGNVVAWDDRPSGAGAAEWLPERTSGFTLEIRNSGPNLDEVEFDAR